jgi:flagellar hook-associated protein 1 FlgK
MFGEGAPEDYMKSLIATLAVDSQESQKMNELQDAVLKNIDTKRESVSGVSIDEEMTNIVKYQNIYNAAAKLITVMDELYSTLINNLGIAGR